MFINCPLLSVAFQTQWFIHSRIGACGLEILALKKLEMQKKMTETQNRFWRATQRILNLPLFIFIRLYSPDPKGKKAKDCFTLIKRTNRAMISSISKTSSSYILSYIFCCLGRTCSNHILDQASCRQLHPGQTSCHNLKGARIILNSLTCWSR